MHAATDPPTDSEAERACWYRAFFRRKGTIGEKDPCGVVSDGAAIEQHPGFTIGIDGPAADNAGITKKQALFARPFNLPVQLADQDGLTMVNGDLGRTDLNLERHECAPLRDDAFPLIYS